MSRRIAGIVFVLVLVAGAGGVFVGRASAQSRPKALAANLPPAWGTYRGTRGNDFVFEDQQSRTIYIIELVERTGRNGVRLVEARERLRITRNPR